MGTVSLLPLLEPIAGATLAVNLAYLNLEMFRYNKKVNAVAAPKIELFNKKPRADGSKNLSQYKYLLFLSGRKNGESFRDAHGSDVKSMVPPVSWAKNYNRMFSSTADVYLCYFFSGFAFLLIILGVAHGIGHLTFSEFLGSPIPTAVWMWLLVIGFLAPIALVIFGRYAVRQAALCVDEYFKEIEFLMKDEARDAPPPDKLHEEDTFVI